MLSINDIAKALNLSNITVRRYLLRGKIKGVKIGQNWRISVEELERIKREGVIGGVN